MKASERALLRDLQRRVEALEAMKVTKPTPAKKAAKKASSGFRA